MEWRGWLGLLVGIAVGGLVSGGGLAVYRILMKEGVGLTPLLLLGIGIVAMIVGGGIALRAKLDQE